MAEDPHREIVVIAGAKTISSLYMAPAFRRLKDYPNVRLIPTVSEKPANVARIVRKGRPTDYMPQLCADDIVYACGAPQMVDAVKEIVLEAGASFHADPFTPQYGSHDDEGIVARAMAWLNAVVPLPGRVAGEQLRMLPTAQAPQHPAPAAFRPPPRQEQLPSGLRQNRGLPARASVAQGLPRRRQPPIQGHHGGAPAK